MPGPVLYLGDTHLRDAAAYLAGLLHHWEWEFDYIPSDQQASSELLESSHSLYIISDYPAAHMAAEQQQTIVTAVEQGAGLIMIGGWESFRGSGGHWDGTPLAEILPVHIAEFDDRVNCDQPVLVHAVREHPCLDGLPWDDRPPVIGGFNRVSVKPEADMLLEARHFSARWDDGECRFEETGSDPLLILGRHGRGTTAALATDVAPHWVGPLVDWGPQRVSAQAPEAGEVEVGNFYERFFKQLLTHLRG